MRYICASNILICTLIAVYMQCELGIKQGEVSEGRGIRNIINRLSSFVL